MVRVSHTSAYTRAYGFIHGAYPCMYIYMCYLFILGDWVCTYSCMCHGSYVYTNISRLTTSTVEGYYAISIYFIYKRKAR